MRIFRKKWNLRKKWMTWSVWSLSWKSILHLAIQEKSLYLQVWCQHGQYEVQPERAYSLDPYRREAFSCKFCGKITSPKFNLKKHTPIIHTEVKPLPACFVATSTVWTKTSRSILRWTILEWGPSLQVLWQVQRKTWRSIFRCSMQDTLGPSDTQNWQQMDKFSVYQSLKVYLSRTRFSSGSPDYTPSGCT